MQRRSFGGFGNGGSGGRRRRSRSRSPVHGIRPKDAKVNEAPRKIVNMLDASAVEEAKEAAKKPLAQRITGPGSDRLTCTIEGPGARRNLQTRLTGPRFSSDGFGNNDRRVEMRSGMGNRFEGRLQFGNNGTSAAAVGGMSEEDRERRQTERDEYLRRRDGDEDKPVMRLVDPSEVPRGGRYFSHDDRGKEGSEWKGREMYDPRKDTGYRRSSFGDRDRYGDRFGGRDRDRDRGGRFGADRWGDRDRDRERRSGGDRDRGDRGRDGGGAAWDGFGRNNNSGYSAPRDDSFGSFGYGGRREPSRADGLWTHDKYLELDDEEEAAKKDDATVVVVEKRSATAADDYDEGTIVVDSSKGDRVIE